VESAGVLGVGVEKEEGFERREDDDIAGCTTNIIPTTTPPVVYQSPGVDRKPSTSKRALPLRATNRTPRRLEIVISSYHVKFT
jgi:hypothetical protein